jgi:type IV secretory pathway TrbL component
MQVNARAWLSPAGLAVAGVAAAAIVGALMWAKYRNNGGMRQLGADVASGAIAGAAGAVDGAATGIAATASDWFGLTPPASTITDVEACRMVLGQSGRLEASQRCSAAAFARALWEGPLYYGNEGRARG